MCTAQEQAWEAAREERGVEGIDRTLSNPHQDEIDAVGTFFEVEQQLAALQASPSQVPLLQIVLSSLPLVVHDDCAVRSGFAARHYCECVQCLSAMSNSQQVGSAFAYSTTADIVMTLQAINAAVHPSSLESSPDQRLLQIAVGCSGS